MSHLRLLLASYLLVVLLLITKFGFFMTMYVHVSCAVVLLCVLWLEERQWRAEQRGGAQELRPQEE